MKTWIQEEHISKHFDALEWMVEKSKQRMNWKAALRYAKKFGNNWRVPTLPELRVLICRDHLFDRSGIPKTENSNVTYWSSTIVDGYIPGYYDNHARSITPNPNGHRRSRLEEHRSCKKMKLYVRCVRNVGEKMKRGEIKLEELFPNPSWLKDNLVLLKFVCLLARNIAPTYDHSHYCNRLQSIIEMVEKYSNNQKDKKLLSLAIDKIDVLYDEVVLDSRESDSLAKYSPENTNHAFQKGYEVSAVKVISYAVDIAVLIESGNNNRIVSITKKAINKANYAIISAEIRDNFSEKGGFNQLLIELANAAKDNPS